VRGGRWWLFYGVFAHYGKFEMKDLGCRCRHFGKLEEMVICRCVVALRCFDCFAVLLRGEPSERSRSFWLLRLGYM
jgi:hypothetical protein